MKVCSTCQQSQATVLVTELVHPEDPTQPVQVREQHLCETCANGQNVPHNPSLKPHDIVKLLQASTQRGRAQVPTVSCPDCGMTLLEFRQKGRMGCAKDYDVFGAHTRELLERIHGATQHTGRLPGQDPAVVERSRRMGELQKELESAIRQEAYEQAARLRDELKSLQSS
jgi:protein arginine kinase activator